MEKAGGTRRKMHPKGKPGLFFGRWSLCCAGTFLRKSLKRKRNASEALSFHVDTKVELTY